MDHSQEPKTQVPAKEEYSPSKCAKEVVSDSRNGSIYGCSRFGMNH